MVVVMLRRRRGTTRGRSSAGSDGYKGQGRGVQYGGRPLDRIWPIVVYTCTYLTRMGKRGILINLPYGIATAHKLRVVRLRTCKLLCE